MNIENMSDNEKSVMLAKLCGWEMRQHSVYKSEYSLYMHGYGSHGYYMTDDVPNLYDPANMAVAWRVLNWANRQTKRESTSKGGRMVEWDVSWATYIDDWLSPYGYEWYDMPPEEAQRALLDKILSLAIEAGMVEVGE